MTPITPPTEQTKIASTRNWVKMLENFAPIAFRIPISLVLSFTDTNIMFMTPIPPTRSDNAVRTYPNGIDRGLDRFYLSAKRLLLVDFKVIILLGIKATGNTKDTGNLVLGLSDFDIVYDSHANRHIAIPRAVNLFECRKRNLYRPVAGVRITACA